MTNVRNRHGLHAEIHNRLQTEYFEKNDKKTMQPRESCYIDRQVEKIIQEGHLSIDERIIDKIGRAHV